MVLSTEDRNGLRQYLLGQLAEDQQESLEKRLLNDDEFFEELEIAEDELVDDHLADELSPDQEQRFEQVFLCSPERRGKLKFARALKRHASVSPVPLSLTDRIRLAWASQTALLRIATVAAVVIVMIGAFWFVRPRLYPPQTFTTLALTISTGNRAEGAPATKVKLPLAVERLRLQLQLPEPGSVAVRYRVDLLSENGDTKSLEVVSQDQGTVVVEIPVSRLTRGQYALNVFVIKADGSEERIRGSYLLTVE